MSKIVFANFLEDGSGHSFDELPRIKSRDQCLYLYCDVVIGDPKRTVIRK